ncbi:ATP-binding protein [Kutzneria albida]|uniref:ATP-binding protein n=1 Tax=Kutzneria albida TaxID=43357 RepID=UPI0004ADED49|nr:tetratricopeptide repeat protein [Kutzneria albida]
MAEQRNETGGGVNGVHAPVTGPVVQAGVISGGVCLHHDRHHTPVPRQLPAAPRAFTGRLAELSELTGAVDRAEEDGSQVISAIAGGTGVGKTWLALHWAHAHRDRFPDGQLFVDLCGFSPGGRPKSPGEVVRGFLDALGVQPERVPADPDSQIGLYRSLVAERRMLVLLDNALDATQITPLLPGSAACTVLVTSQHHLPALRMHGAHLLRLPLLPEHEARELLVGQLGADRVDTEPEAVTDLLHYCAGLPRAVGIVAARAADRPDLPLALLAEELRDASARLDAFDAGDIPTSLRTVFSCSYHALTPEAAEVFRLLGLAPGPDIGLAAAASLAALSTARTRALLRTLEVAHLVRQHQPGRYQVHDLVRLFAWEQAQLPEHRRSREQGLLRLLDFYLHTAHQADRLLDPDCQRVVLEPPAPGCVPLVFGSRQAALEWFGREHANLIAAQQIAHGNGLHTHVWQIAWAMHAFHWWCGHLHDDLSVWRLALAAADHLGEPPALALANQMLANACSRLGMHEHALEHVSQALAIAEWHCDLNYRAATHHCAAGVLARCGTVQQALGHAMESLRLYRSLSHPVRQAWALAMIGAFNSQLGADEAAESACQDALALFSEHGHRTGEAATLHHLGRHAQRLGRPRIALHHYERSAELARVLGTTYAQADTLASIGRIRLTLAELGPARSALVEAMRLYRSQHRTAEADRVQQLLAGF